MRAASTKGRLWVSLGAVGLIAIGLGLVWAWTWSTEEIDRGGASAATVALGRTLYAENCAVCHGANLEGQPDWRSRLPSGRLPAPPHDATGHTWHHSDGALFQLTREGTAAVVGGGYQSDMPAFGDVLSDEEIQAILAFIKSTWPERERRYQAQITRRELDAERATDVRRD